jgi:ABC-2 type transport system permease protein
LQPAIWLLLLGQVIAYVRGLDAGGSNYFDFLTPGRPRAKRAVRDDCYGIPAIWDHDLGILHRYMVSPTPRSALVLGKAGSSAVRGLLQAVIAYLLAVLMSIDVSFNPLHLLGVAVLIALGSARFATFSLAVACIIKTRERFLGIGQLLTLPVCFASNAIYPTRSCLAATASSASALILRSSFASPAPWLRWPRGSIQGCRHKVNAAG